MSSTESVCTQRSVTNFVSFDGPTNRGRAFVSITTAYLNTSCSGVEREPPALKTGELEKEAEYVEIARLRIAEAQAQGNLFG